MFEVNVCFEINDVTIFVFEHLGVEYSIVNNKIHCMKLCKIKLDIVQLGTLFQPVFRFLTQKVTFNKRPILNPDLINDAYIQNSNLSNKCEMVELEIYLNDEQCCKKILFQLVNYYGDVNLRLTNKFINF